MKLASTPTLRRAAGFTLIEVMVVIVILGVLAALIVPRVLGRPDEARVVAAKQDISSIMQALKLYKLDNRRYPNNDQGLSALVQKPSAPPVPDNWKAYLDNRRYPSTEQGLQSLVSKPSAPPVPDNWKSYLEKLPNDPWGSPYQYLSPGLQGEVDVLSYGADGKPGGEGVDADIGSWAL